MTTPRKIVRLADLEKDVGEVELASGAVVAVRPIDGRAEQFRQTIADGTAEPGDMWRFAALLIPDATPEDIQALTPTAIGIIAQMAGGQLETVLALAAVAEKKLDGMSPTSRSSLAIG